MRLAGSAIAEYSREAAHYADTATDLPVELFNDVIDTNAISIE